MTFDYNFELNDLKLEMNSLSGDPNKDINDLEEIKNHLSSLIGVINWNINGYYVAVNEYDTDHSFCKYTLLGRISRQEALRRNESLDNDNAYYTDVFEVSKDKWEQFSELARWRNIKNMLMTMSANKSNVVAFLKQANRRIVDLSNALHLQEDVYVEFYKK